MEDEEFNEGQNDSAGETIAVSLDATAGGKRLDRALADSMPQLSRTRLRALIDQGHVIDSNSGTRLSASTKIVPPLHLVITLPPPEPATPQAEDIALDVVFEDEHFLIINKPAGLVVHPGAGNWTGTLVNALLHHCRGQLSGIGGVERPGIVHRLDRDTSGLMVAAKSDMAHRALSAQLEDRSLSRNYAAICFGIPAPREGVIEVNIGRDPRNRQRMAALETGGGRFARTRYRVKRALAMGQASLVHCSLDTGRTHQIRVHLAWIGHPIAGDTLYAGRHLRTRAHEHAGPGAMRRFPRQALHARALKLRHPASGEEMQFEADYPNDFRELLSSLE